MTGTELANVNDIAIVKGGNKVLAITKDLDGAILIKNNDNTYNMVTISIMQEHITNTTGNTISEKVFNIFSKEIDECIEKHGVLNSDTWGDIVSHGNADDFKKDFYISPEKMKEIKESILESQTCAFYDEDTLEEITDEEVYNECLLPIYLVALNMQDISVWFN